MMKRRRRLFSATESAEAWDRWQRGDGLSLIGRVIGKPASVSSSIICDRTAAFAPHRDDDRGGALFLLGWTAPSGIAMCQGEVVVRLTKEAVRDEHYPR